MIVATHEILERLDRMPDAELLKVVNAVWEPFEGDDKWGSKTAPDRETFKALLRALTDDWPVSRTPQAIDRGEMQRKAQGA